MQERTVLCLELENADIDKFRSLREDLQLQGISFLTLTEEQARHPENWLARFAAMDNATRTADKFAPRTPEEIARRIADFGPEPAGCLVADDGKQLIGYTYFHRAFGEDMQRARQGWTGVRLEYRRKGIATALKIEAILLAQELGYRRIVTDPRTENIASVQMSLRLGFHPCDSDAGLLA